MPISLLFPLLIKCHSESDYNNYTHLILEGKPRRKKKKKAFYTGTYLKAVLIFYPVDLNAIQKTVNRSEEKMTTSPINQPNDICNYVKAKHVHDISSNIFNKE